jgi:hypothetical protein
MSTLGSGQLSAIGGADSFMAKAGESPQQQIASIGLIVHERDDNYRCL